MHSIFETPNACYEFDGHGLLVVTLSDDVELDVDDVKEQRRIAFGFTQDRPHVVLAIAGQRTSATEEARKYASSHAPAGRVAEAVIIKSLPVRIMGNFFLKFHKPGLPTKLFDNRNKAVKWLKDQLEDAREKRAGR